MPKSLAYSWLNLSFVRSLDVGKENWSQLCKRFLDGGQKAAAITRARVVTAAMDSLRVRAVPDIDRDMVMRARINLIGRSSMEVGIHIEQPGEPLLHIGSSYFEDVPENTYWPSGFMAGLRSGDSRSQFKCGEMR